MIGLVCQNRGAPSRAEARGSARPSVAKSTMLLESIAGWLGHALSDDVRQHVAHSLDSIFVAFEALVEGAVRSAQQRIAGSLCDAPDLGSHALPDQD